MALSPAQIQIARALTRSPLYGRAGPKVRLAEQEAALVESNLSNPPGGDRDSIGVLQQRPSQGWGSPAQVGNPVYASTQFLKRAIPLAGKYGNAGDLAQAVQRSAFPERYGQRAGEARDVLARLGGGEPSAGGGGAATGAVSSYVSGELDLGALAAQLHAVQPDPRSVVGLAVPTASSEGPRIPSAPQQSSSASSALTGALAALSGQQSAEPSAIPNGVKRDIPKGIVNARGGVGFTPARGTTYTGGALPLLTRRLDALARQLGIKLTGISGGRTPKHSVEVGGFANDPHTKHLASDTEGVQHVSKAQLNAHGLERPFPGAREADHIQLLHSVNRNGGY